jgi:hypothetical protein
MGSHRTAEVLAAQAANEALPLDVVAPLVDGDNRAILVALARRPALTLEVAERLSRADPAVRLALAGNPHAAQLVGEVLAQDDSPEIRQALACGDRSGRAGGPLPLPVQWRLAADTEPEVRRWLAIRRDLATEVRARLASDAETAVRRFVDSRGLPEPWRRALLTDRDLGVRTNALIPGDPPPLDLVPGLLADPLTRDLTAAIAPLFHDQVEALLADPDPAVRAAVAGNPLVEVDDILALAADNEDEVRLELVLREDISDDLRHQLLAGLELADFTVVHWLYEQQVPLPRRLSFVDSPFVFCRRAVAFSTDLPPAAVARLAVDEDHSVRLLIAERYADVPGPVIAALAQTAGHASWDMVRHPAMPAQTLVDFARSGNPALRRLAAAGPNLPPEAAIALTTDLDAECRGLAAANPALPVEEIVRLVHGDDISTARGAATNPRLPVDVAAAMVRQWQTSLHNRQ